MIELINNTLDFEKVENEFKKLFLADTPFERNVFNNQFSFFLAFEFDFTFHEDFWELIRKATILLKRSKLVFYTTNPSPIDFYKANNVFSIFEIEANCSDSELNDVMMKKIPNEKNGINLIDILDDFMWFTYDNSWSIAASREWDTAIVGFNSLRSMENFLTLVSDEWKHLFMSIEDYLKNMAETFNYDRKQIETFKVLQFAYTSR